MSLVRTGFVSIPPGASPGFDHADFSVPSSGPHGLWLDEGRLLCAADGAALVVVDRDTGDLLAGVVCSFDSARSASARASRASRPGRSSRRSATSPR